jgi:hypothetical protein
MAEPTSLACNLAAFNPEQADRHQILAHQVQRAVQAVRELPDGYAFRLPGEAAICLMIAEFITLERLCCPFLRFVLEVEPDEGPLWLKMTGQASVKRFLEMELPLGDRP